MNKKFLSSLIFSVAFSLQAMASDVTLGDIIDASKDVREFVSSTRPLQFVEHELQLAHGRKSAIRFFFYFNKENPNSQFGDVFVDNKKAQEDFKSDPQRMPGVIYIAASDEEKAKGIFYTLSLDDPRKSEADKMPKVGEAVKWEVIKRWGSSPLIWPGKHVGIVTINGAQYQIRHCKFNNSDGQAGKDTLGAFVEEQKLRGLKPVKRNQGYGEYFEYNLDQSHGPVKYPQLVVSIAKVD